MSSTVGYVVIEYNQASGIPELVDGADLHWDVKDACEEANWHAEATASAGRRETFRVAEVVLLDEVAS